MASHKEKKSEDEAREEQERRRVNPPVPDDLQEYKGRYKYLQTGEEFGLKIVPDSEVRAHKTHHAKSARSFWDGTAEQFRELFDKI
jgi:hypothetical protein